MEVAAREVSGTRAAGLHVVVSGVASDAHTWNLVFLQLLLEELGHRVTNLGPCVPDRTLLAECRELRPDLLVLSSVNGHGGADGRRVARLLREDPECGRLPMVIGGKLGISGPDGQETGPLLEAGFDAVFEDGSGLASFRSFLQSVEAGRRAIPASVAP
ncbi:methylaspartate mutase [Streptomyces sp. RKND-216]|uniref:cobalamin B12-binding domain-containing protein n=1 Tax=Streptomyces sp. RKND-216 TaxID=2562581 RepID=UPI00109DEFBE|nr:cobalamin-dependent protein [Streptomyces sp. RKND-216]THA23951.1 methylaspartate mutase [Streptomyces sp. RKND-216]